MNKLSSSAFGKNVSNLPKEIQRKKHMKTHGFFFQNNFSRRISEKKNFKAIYMKNLFEEFSNCNQSNCWFQLLKDNIIIINNSKSNLVRYWTREITNKPKITLISTLIHRNNHSSESPRSISNLKQHTTLLIYLSKEWYLREALSYLFRSTKRKNMREFNSTPILYGN